MTTTDEAMVETVARAIEVQLTSEDGWEVGTPQLKRMCQDFARAAIAAMPPAPQWRTIDSVPEGHVVLVCDTKNNRWTDMVIDGDGTDTCGFPLAYWMPLPTPPAGDDQ